MNTYRIAHLHHQGHNVVLVEIEQAFHYRTLEQQRSTLGYLQRAVGAAGLAGEVALFWEGPDGRAQYLAFQKWQVYCRSIDLAFVRGNVNRELRCA